MERYEAEQFLRNYYQEDALDADRIREDDERFEWIMGNPERFPNANVEFITQFGDAAESYLASTPAG